MINNQLRIKIILLCFFLLASSSIYSAVIRVDSDTDLETVTSRVKNGDVIELAARHYTGQLLIKAKSITVRGPKTGYATISSSRADTLIHVSHGGSLVINNIRLEVGRKTQSAIHVDKGEVHIAQCVIQGKNNQLINNLRGQLSLSHCNIYDSGSQAMVISNRASLKMDRVKFFRMKNKGVVIEKNSEAIIQRSVFNDFGSIALLAINHAKVKVDNSVFDAGQSTAIHVENDSELELQRSEIKSINDYGLVLLSGSRLKVIKSSISEIRSIAIVETDSKLVSVVESEFNKVGQVLTINKSSAQLVFNKNKINRTDDSTDAVAISSSENMQILDNYLANIGGGFNLQLKPGASLKFNRNRIINSKKTALYVAQSSDKKGVWHEAQQNQLVNNGSPAILVDKGVLIKLNSNLILGNSQYGVYVQDKAAVQFINNLIHAETKSVFYHSSSGNEGSMQNDILTAGIYRTNLHQNMNPGQRMSALLKDSKNRLHVNQEIAHFISNTKQINRLDKFSQFENALKTFNANFEQFQVSGLNQASISVFSLDAAGQEFPAGFELYDQSGKLLSKYSRSNPIAFVSPGTYRVRFGLKTLPPQEIQVGDGEQKKLHIDMPDHIVLSLGYPDAAKGWQKTKTAFLMNDVKLRRKYLQFKNNYGYASRRGDSTQADLQQSLGLVRKELVNMRTQFRDDIQRFAQPALSNSEMVKQKLQQWHNAFNWAHQVLAIAGNKQDAQDLIKLAISEKHLRNKRLQLAAYIEHRLGILDKGAAIKALAKLDSAAKVHLAAVLASYNIDKARAILIKALQSASNTQETFASVKALMQINSAEVVAGMKQVIVAFNKAQTQAEEGAKATNSTDVHPTYLWDAAAYASVYLLSYGDRDAMRLAATVLYKDSHYKLLIGLIQQPNKLIDYYLGFKGPAKPSYRPMWVSDLCDLIIQLPKKTQLEFVNQFESSLVKAGMLNKISKSGVQADIEKARSEYYVAASECRANSTTAKLLYNKESRYLSTSNWIEKPWLFTQSVEDFRLAKANAGKQLEQFDFHLLKNTIASPRMKQSVKYPELFLAFRKIGTRQCNFDRCAFALSMKENLGVVTGVLHLDQNKTKKRYKVMLDFDFAGHPYRLLSQIAPPKQKHGISTPLMQARALIKQVYLMQDNRKIRLRARTRNRMLEYSGTLANDGTKNLYLIIELKLGDSVKYLSFPAFAI